jgi:hypothetical protein
MAKMSFSSDNVAKSADNFPRLKLDQDETARIYVYDEPEFGFVHNLRTPKLINGVPQYKSGRDGKEELDFDFVGNPICTGDINVLLDRGSDPKNCVACEAAAKEPDMFQKPKRRFAMHVFQYNTNGTSKPSKNFQGTVKVWSFTDQKFAEIADLAEEAPNKSIKNVDLILGPCENKMFQKFKIISSGQVKWQESEATKSTFAEIIEENKAEDLDFFLGRPVKKVEYLLDDLDKVRRNWRIINGVNTETNADNLVGAERNLDAGLSNLLDTKPEPATAKVELSADTPKKDKEDAVNLEDLLNGL